MKIKDILKICDGKLICGNIEDEITTYSKDSRNIKENDMYLGIKGENYNGNDYYLEALEKGAIGCIIDDKSVITKKMKNIILVKDTVNALHLLAADYLKKHNIFVIAITGSVGKTSTKEMVYSVIKSKYKTLKTEGNYNGQIGLPLTILRLKDEEVLVIEMGMSNFGEIKKLTKIVKPDIAVITNIGTAHIGNLGSRENILKAKLEIVDGLKNDGTLIINNDDELLNNYAFDDINVIRYGINNISDYAAGEIKRSNKEIQFKIKNKKITIPNMGNVYIYNALVAFIIGNICKVPNHKIKKSLKKFTNSKGRMEIVKINNITLINDFYNANYDSIKNSLEYLGNQKGRKIAVLGDVLELGNFSKKIHKMIGYEVLKNKIDILITIGKEAKQMSNIVNREIKCFSYNNLDDAYLKITNLLNTGDIVLFKASHGMNFQVLSDNLLKYYNEI